MANTLRGTATRASSQEVTSNQAASDGIQPAPSSLSSTTTKAPGNSPLRHRVDQLLLLLPSCSHGCSFGLMVPRLFAYVPGCDPEEHALLATLREGLGAKEAKYV